jgi:microcystin-dependent protein
MKINIFQEIIKIVLIIFIIIMIIKIFFNNENFATNNNNTSTSTKTNTNTKTAEPNKPNLPDNFGDIVVDNLIANSIDIFPKGIITAWAGKDVPEGWIICNGKNETPDLSNKFIFGAGTGPSLTPRKLGDIGGVEEITLKLNELGNHKHHIDTQTNTRNGLTNIGGSPKGFGGGQTQNIANANTGNTGGDMPHNNMPPYYVLAFIMKT